MGKTETTGAVVCDAGPIIHLDELACLHLMRDFARVLVPKGVCEEVQNHRCVTFDASDISWSVVQPHFPLDTALDAMCKAFSLDKGETEALGIVADKPDAMFLTDDAAARLVATELGFRVHGTIGVLIRGVRRNLMEPEELIATLNRLPADSTLHVKPALLEEVIAEVKSHFR